MDHCRQEWQRHRGAHAKVAVAFAAALGLAPALADELGPWNIDWKVEPSGAKVYTASLYSSTLIDSGIGEDGYAPTLTLACRSKGEPRWSIQLRLEDSVSDDKETEVTVALDDAAPVEQVWQVADKRHVLVHDGAADIAALKRAKKLTLSWNWGWSWLWLSDEATFDLTEIRAALYTLAKSCGLPQP